MRLRTLWGGVLVVFLSFWVALALAPVELAHVDEKHVLWQATSYNPLEIARNLMRDSHPPLYYWLIWLWWQIGGFDRPWAYRAFSVLLGLPALPLGFRLGTQIGGRRLGWMVMLFLMLNPFYLFQLSLIRMYGLVIALGAFLTWAWLRWLDRPASSGWWKWGWVLGSGVLLFTHYYGALLVAVQVLFVLLRRPAGWRTALGGFTLLAALFFGWLLQAYAGSVDTTVRNLSAIPVRPLPWEVVEHFWANLLSGPLADGAFARAGGLAAAILALAAALVRPRPRLPARWTTLGAMVWIPLVVGSMLALRWPFFGARYFAMLLVPFLTWALALFVRHRWMLAVWLIPGLIGLSGFPMLIGKPDAGDTREISVLSLADPSNPILIQAWWHALWPEYPLSRAYDWSDPVQRGAVVSRSDSFWFIGVSLYRGIWEGWIQGLRETHTVDYHIEVDHPVPERRASIFHLTRARPPRIWEEARIRWENGLRLERVGWVDQVLRAGEPLSIALEWTTERATDRRWTMFLHLTDLAGQLWANWDAEPDPPVNQWMPGEVMEIRRSLLIPLNVPPGRYRVNVGWYETGTPGFPRLPLADPAGDVWTLGEIEVQPRREPLRIGAIQRGPVELDPPMVRLLESPQGWRVQARFQWRSLDEVSTGRWRVQIRGAGEIIPLERLYPIPEARVRSPGGLTEVWISPPLAGRRPALGWLEILYEGQILTQRPVWMFPTETGWIYGWLFLNRFER
ncbi:glycosyltransferase family 39 protein [Thermoflexus sp.]|uniref:glycosyltransferase family 39 protein n=1 Tax=Thermoflexus sp. TaxID=1969742 RepID=UPI002630EFF4|nr:glycosyltransferase family 39 protein [Thermoflexus sp.]MCX7690854.1 glycosyltransferase family 39 protein [Thermoflexus sp.]